MNTEVKKEQWQEVQDRFYNDVDKHTHLTYEPKSIYAKDLTTHMVHALGLTGREHVLEVGAGAGRFSLHLLPSCGRLAALDTSAALLETLEREKPVNALLEVMCASVFDLPGPVSERVIDVICGFFILHHLPDHEKLFTLIRQTLKPGGRIGFIEPNRLNPLFLLQVMFSKEMTWEAEKGMVTFSARRTMKLLERAGFMDIRVQRFGFFPPPILDRIPGMLKFQRALERFLPLRRFLPFVLISAKRP